MHYAVFIPKFQPFYRHPVPGFIVTGIVTLACVLFMVYVWATNFGPLAPGRRPKTERPAERSSRGEDRNQAPGSPN